MPSLKKFRKMTGLPDTVRRWKDAAEIVKDGQQSLVDQAEAPKPPTVTVQYEVDAEGAPVSKSQTVAVQGHVLNIDAFDAKVKEAARKLKEAIVTERPESIKRDGKHYQPVETLHEWYPEIAKHLDAVPLANMLTALELDSFEEFGTLWIQDIGNVSNGYFTFEHEGDTYDKYLIPVPEGWAVLRDYLPDEVKMDQFIGYLEPHIKSGIRKGFVAPLQVIEETLERIKVRPLTWNFTPESWLIPKQFREREVGIPGLMESYMIKARKGRKAVPAESVPDDVRAWYEAVYGSKAKCETCNGEGTVFDRKTYRVDFCPACDASGMV